MSEHSPELKPCPFCGDDAVLGKCRDELFWMVMCVGCDAEVETWKKDDAIANWNRRADTIDTEGLAVRIRVGLEDEHLLRPLPGGPTGQLLRQHPVEVAVKRILDEALG